MAKTRYRITQDRWCWCGAPAALRVEGGEEPIPVCSIDHGQTEIERLQNEIIPMGPARNESLPEESDEGS